jgi:hypothetical protein
VRLVEQTSRPPTEILESVASKIGRADALGQLGFDFVVSVQQ